MLPISMGEQRGEVCGYEFLRGLSRFDLVDNGGRLADRGRVAPRRGALGLLPGSDEQRHGRAARGGQQGPAAGCTANSPSIHLDIGRSKRRRWSPERTTCSVPCGPHRAVSTPTTSTGSDGFGELILSGSPIGRNDVCLLRQIYIRNKYSDKMPLRSVAAARVVVRRQVIRRYHDCRAIPI